MARTAVGVPPLLARRANRVLRPRDAEPVYAHPRAEFARLTQLGVLRKIATGYFVLVPQNRVGDQRWKPSLDAIALGLGQADYGAADVALMGVSAARHHGAMPRAIAVAVVVVPKQRPVLQTEFGRVVFAKRVTARLDVERIETPLATGWITTIEQTLIDLAARPTLGGLTDLDAVEAIRSLGGRADWELVARLAHEQRRPAALRTATVLFGQTNA
jgi:AbiEi antitoxin C-terminal domain